MSRVKLGVDKTPTLVLRDWAAAWSFFVFFWKFDTNFVRPRTINLAGVNFVKFCSCQFFPTKCRILSTWLFSQNLTLTFFILQFLTKAKTLSSFAFWKNLGVEFCRKYFLFFFKKGVHKYKKLCYNKYIRLRDTSSKVWA